MHTELSVPTNHVSVSIGYDSEKPRLLLAGG